MTHWEHFDHGADVGVRGIGNTPGEAFEQAALALTAAVTDPACVRPDRAVRIACTAPDLELLLVDWLNAVVFEMARRDMSFGSFDVKLDGTALAATAYGEPVERARHRPAVEVKGATYTVVEVKPRSDGSWIAQCVIDV